MRAQDFELRHRLNDQPGELAVICASCEAPMVKLRIEHDDGCPVAGVTDTDTFRRMHRELRTALGQLSEYLGGGALEPSGMNMRQDDGLVLGTDDPLKPLFLMSPGREVGPGEQAEATRRWRSMLLSLVQAVNASRSDNVEDQMLAAGRVLRRNGVAL
jgi:hypothetical protein